MASVPKVILQVARLVNPRMVLEMLLPGVVAEKLRASLVMHPLVMEQAACPWEVPA